jgi:drug/metabolite transporter (DMT)-like permease
MNQQNKALLWLNLALILSSMTALFAKIIKLPINQVIFGRSIIGAIAMFLFLLLTKRQILLNHKRDYARFTITGLLLGLHWLTYFQSIRLSSVGIGIISLYTYPVICIILEPFFDKTKHQFKDLLIGAIVFSGVFLMAPEIDLSNEITQGVLWGILSAFIYSVRNIIMRGYAMDYPPVTNLMYQVIVTALLLAPSLAFNYEAFDSSQISNLIVLGVIFTSVHHSLIAYVLRFFKVKTLSVISTVQPVYALIIGYLVLNEIPTGRTLIGGSIVIAAAIYETRNHVSRKRLSNTNKSH